MYRKIIEDLKIWKESPSQKFEVFPRKIRHTAFYKVFVGKLPRGQRSYKHSAVWGVESDKVFKHN